MALPSRYNTRMKPVVPGRTAESVEALLPQTQCRLCGYNGCRPYAEAIAAGHAAINRCPPGGDDTIRDLARLTGVPYAPLDPAFGAETPPAIAIIDETLCIGCTLCIQACPVDAIAGAAKHMHTVIADECTGCRLCIPPCPVDCIAMIETGAVSHAERARRAAQYKRRHDARLARLEQERIEGLQADHRRLAEQKKRATVQRAMQRAHERLNSRE
jgi:Na+-translocating ferredoxin:NAD+ oxidoreductase subunit B